MPDIIVPLFFTLIYLHMSSIISSKKWFEAIHDCNLDAIKDFVEQGVDVNMSDSGFTAMHKLASRNSLDCIMYIAEHGADVYAHVGGDERGYTPLMVSLFYKRFDVAEYLLEKFYNPFTEAEIEKISGELSKNELSAFNAEKKIESIKACFENHRLKKSIEVENNQQNLKF